MFIKMININFFNRSEKITFYIFLSFASALAISTFIICNHLAEKSCMALIQGWFSAEAIDIQQGNLYSVLSKAQRTLTGSGLISSGKVFKIENGELSSAVFSFGNESIGKLSSDYYKVNEYKSQIIGPFKYEISFVSSLNDKYLFVFIAAPSHMRLIGMIAVLGFLGAIIFLYILVTIQIKSRIDVITVAVRSVSEGNLPEKFLKSESPYLIKILSALLLDLQEKKKIELENASLQGVLSLAKQVSHDIRSPLSALNMAVSTINDLREEKRLLIRNATQRINDIANDLLQKSKSTKIEKVNKATSTDLTSTKELTNEFVPALIDILISEKRIQYREFTDLDIDINFKNSFGAFAKVDSSELKRVLSNLINNSVEAFNNHIGKIAVTVYRQTDQNTVEIAIQDNGRGIPQHVLSELGKQSISYGKEGTNSGSGIGFYHAVKAIESFGGKLLLESKLGVGTVVRIILPIADVPSWFAERIDLIGRTHVISLDDDTSIHQIWADRFQSNDTNKINHIKFQSGDMFEKYVYENMSILKNMFFLIDYELLNQSRTGLDLIEELGLERQSILVTSHYEELDVQQRCNQLRLKILLKSSAELVPISI